MECICDIKHIYLEFCKISVRYIDYETFISVYTKFQQVIFQELRDLCRNRNALFKIPAKIDEYLLIINSIKYISNLWNLNLIKEA